MTFLITIVNNDNLLEGMEMLNVAVMFGGRSVEHEVSVITGLQIMKNLDRAKYNVIPIYVGKDGWWYTGNELLDIENYRDVPKLLSKCKRVVMLPIPGLRKAYFYPFKRGFFKGDAESLDVDIVIPAFHGTYGEDGSMQGFLELLNIPYVGSGVLGSALGMDKILMKEIFKANNIPIVNYLWFLRRDYEEDEETVLSYIEKSLRYPLFVKPSNLGSSIGISKAKNRDELIYGIEVATKYDRRILVEEGVEDVMEVNCSVMGFDNDVATSLCEMPVPWQEFLSYSDKYMKGEVGEGLKGALRKVPAPISKDLEEEIKELAVKIFKLLDCAGVVRVDFLIDKREMKIYANEVNTLPGSFAFYLWEPLGIPFRELLDRLINLAIRRHREYTRNIYTFDTDLLIKASLRGSKLGKRRET